MPKLNALKAVYYDLIHLISVAPDLRAIRGIEKTLNTKYLDCYGKEIVYLRGLMAQRVVALEDLLE